MKSERDSFEKFSKISHVKMPSQKQRELWESIENEIDQMKPVRMNRRRNVFGTSVASVAALVIVAGGIYGISNHQKPVSNHHTSTAATIPQAETSLYQKYVNQMTPAQQYKLHQLLTRDTQFADLWIYGGDTDPTLVAQMESDFKEFQTLFPQQMASIKAEPDSFYEQTDPSALSPGVDGNVLTGSLSEIYLAYEAAIWNMGDPNSNLYNYKLAQLVKRPNVPGVFSQWNRLFFGGRIDVDSLTKDQ